jgi:hypothetical protein
MKLHFAKKPLFVALAFLIVAAFLTVLSIPARAQMCTHWCEFDCQYCHIMQLFDVEPIGFVGPIPCPTPCGPPIIDGKIAPDSRPSSHNKALTVRGWRTAEDWRKGHKGKAFDHRPYVSGEVLKKVMEYTVDPSCKNKTS